MLPHFVYGPGLRNAYAQQMCIKDIDFTCCASIVRFGKGERDRLLMLPQSLMPALREQSTKAQVLQSADQAAGSGRFWG